VVGDGLSTHFWHDPWCGPTILRVRFRRLFHLSLQVDHKVGGVRSLGGGCLGLGFHLEEIVVCLGI